MPGWQSHPPLSLGIGTLVNQAVMRGTGRLLTNTVMQRLLPNVAARAAAAEAQAAATVAQQVVARQAQHQAAVAGGRMLLTPPQWLIKALEIVPQQLWKEKWMTVMMAPFRFLPLAGAHLYVNSEMGTQNRPRGAMGTAHHLATSSNEQDQEMRLTLARSEAIIPTLMAGMPEDKKALLILSDDDVRLMIAHLDGQVSARLRDDPKLRAERIDDEMRLFLRAQLLMDYWLGIQNWADQLRMTAAMRCRETTKSLR
ncbi:MAG: hypothetical protein GEV13_08895 [Rhodospirillales bacterium]|nr:hypothetical protein [Rhodospirillales bacterium]